MKKYDAIIIGSGIGGLAAGLMLAHKQKKVLIVEKNKLFGGRLTSSKRGDFIVDMNVHIISRSDKGPLGEVLKRTGVENTIAYTKVRPVTSYDKQIFTFPHDLKTMTDEQEFDSLMRFMSDIRAFSEEEVQEYDDIYLQDFLLGYTQNKLIHACITNISLIYLCLPPWLASAGEFMRCLRWETQARASGYPEGGCGAVTNLFVESIKKYGGELLNNTAVARIKIDGNKVSGIVTADAEYEADMIISNADIKQTVLKLAGTEHFAQDYVDYVQALKYSWSGPVIRVALDKKLTDIKMLSQFGSIDQEAYYQKIQDGIVPDELNLFLVIPSNFSPRVVPEGKQLVNFSTPIPIDTPVAMQKKLNEAMVNTAEKYIPGLRDHILWQETMNLDSMAKYAGEEGAGIGIGQMPGQVGQKRPKINTPVEGLYIVGAEAGGAGVGIELAINSALEFIDHHCG